MKERLRKIALISCAIFFALFSILIQPYENVKAAPVAIPAGLTAAAGIYTLSALGVAALIGPANPEVSEEMKQHANEVWGTASQAAIDSLNWTVGQATGIGTGIVSTQADFQNFIDKKLNGIAANSFMAQQTLVDDSAITFSKSYNEMMMVTGYGNADIGLQLISNGKTASGVTIRMQEGYIYTNVGFTDGTAAINDWNFVGNDNMNAAITLMQNVTTAKGMASFVNTFGSASMAFGTAAHPLDLSNYTQGVSRTREMWEAMRDAGLVLPVDEFVPMSIDGQPLTYNPATGALTGIDGGVYTGEASWRIPNLRWREKTDAIPQAGVWADFPTYVPELEADAPAADIPYTTTNVTTGTTVANPDYATDIPTTAPPPTTTPPPPYIPPFEEGGSSGLDFTPLMTSGDVMSKKFPFSIPFDFVRQISVFDVAPEAPVFKVAVPEFLQIEAISIPMNFSIALEMFDPIANIIRWGNVILFDIGLIFAIRKFLPE